MMCNKDQISNNFCNHIEELLECTKRNVEYKCEILFDVCRGYLFPQFGCLQSVAVQFLAIPHRRKRER